MSVQRQAGCQDQLLVGDYATLPVWRRGENDFPLPARDLTALWEQNTEKESENRTRLGRPPCFTSPWASSAVFLPAPQSHVKAPACVKQTPTWALCLLEDRVQMYVPKARWSSLGAALQLHPIHTVPQEWLSASKSEATAFSFWFCPTLSSTAHDNIKRLLASKGNYFKCVPLSPFTVENVACWNWLRHSSSFYLLSQSPERFRPLRAGAPFCFWESTAKATASDRL